MQNRLIALLLVGIFAAPASAQEARHADDWRAFAAHLEPNAFVRISLVSGETLRAHVVRADEESLRVNPKTRVAVPIRTFRYEEIRSIDRQKEPKWNPASKVLLGVGITFGVLYLVALAALAGYD
jgi:hypothetical protein